MHISTLLALLPLAMAAPAKRSSPAPVLTPRGAQVIDGKYIVRMKPGVKAGVVTSALSGLAAKADHTYSQAFHGFAASLTGDELTTLKNSPDVDYIEQDAVVRIKVTQEDADWGLARLSNDKPGSSTYTYDESAGEGTCAYIIDTGVEADHPEFEGRAKFLANYAGDNEDSDGNGHGTHVAGTIGSKTYGVSKKTTLFGVKVLDANGEGSNSGVIAGMDFVAKDAKGQQCPKGVVVNMSLGGPPSDAVNQAAKGITSAGLFLAVAAGNEAADASTSSPASEESVCTVGATEKDDSFASYSNFGSLVDVLAPGTDIESTWIGGGKKTISGTSMATPHVAGIGAYYLGMGQKVDGLCEYLASVGLKGAIKGVPSGTKNSLINNGAGGGNATRVALRML